jgi:hypothetical protein
MNPSSPITKPKKRFHRTRTAVKYSAYAAGGLAIVYAVTLYFIFFVFQRATIASPAQAALPTYASPEDALRGKNLITYLDRNASKEIQPINVVIAVPPSSTIASVFEKFQWTQSPIFSDKSMTIANLYALARHGVMPVADLYFNGVKQEYAFQNQSHSILKREHIRLWTLGHMRTTGATLYAGSISYDNGIGLFDYKKFIVPLHQIDPNVDASRDALLSIANATGITQQSWYDPAGVIRARATGEAADEQSFFSDGKILILYVR